MSEAAPAEVPEIKDKIQPGEMGEVYHYQYEVKMSCGGCSGAVERALGKIPASEIIKYTVNLQTKLVDVWCTIPYDDVLAVIKDTKKEVVDGKVLPVLPGDLTV